MLVLVGFLTQAWEPVIYFGNLSIQHFNILVEQCVLNALLLIICVLFSSLWAVCILISDRSG